MSPRSLAEEVKESRKEDRKNPGRLISLRPLNWKFIENVLQEIDLPHSLIALIMLCVSTVSYQICFNGELTERFAPSNGIRQGDPLSPYLFVLRIEKLSHLIADAVNRNVWKPVKASQFGPGISHLFFADDIIIFAELPLSKLEFSRDAWIDFVIFLAILKSL